MVLLPCVLSFHTDFKMLLMVVRLSKNNNWFVLVSIRLLLILPIFAIFFESTPRRHIGSDLRAFVTNVDIDVLCAHTDQIYFFYSYAHTHTSHTHTFIQTYVHITAYVFKNDISLYIYFFFNMILYNLYKYINIYVYTYI